MHSFLIQTRNEFLFYFFFRFGNNSVTTVTMVSKKTAEATIPKKIQ